MSSGYDAQARRKRYRVEHVTKTPEFIAADAPTLDPVKWPEARWLKGSANYASDYVRHAIEVMVEKFGMHTACNLVATAMRTLAIQYVGGLRDLAGAEGNSVGAIAKTYQEILRSFKNEVQLTQVDADTVTLSFDTFAPFPYPESPEMRDAIFAYFDVGTRVLNGHVRITRAFDAGTETWTLTDTHTWLW